MNIKKSLLTSAFALGCLCMSAQQAGGATEYVFNPHWYGQLQVGGQETLGEGSFGKLLSPNIQLAAGYQFNPLIGLRANINTFSSKGTMNFDGSRGYWKWNYIAPAVDVMFDVTNVVLGYNPERCIDVNLFGGVGLNIAWNNKEANTYNTNNTINGVEPLAYLWDGTKARLLGRFGIAGDYKINEQISVGLELSANVLNDHYNSKRAGNADWYFNALVGVKYVLGPAYTKKAVEIVTPVEVAERVVEVVKEVPVEVIKEVPVYSADEISMERNVFFTINSSVISIQEEQKVKEIAEYMKAHPNTKVHITGYADKGTGTLQINLRLSRERAEAVAKMLKTKYGIAADRISTSSMTSHEFQPFADPVLNRVAICVAE